MCNYKKFFLFIFFAMAFQVKAIPLSGQSILPNVDTVKKEDLTYGNALLSLNRELRFGGPTNYTLDVLEKTKKSEIFQINKNFVQQVKTLKNSNLNLAEIGSVCYKKTAPHRMNPIKESLEENFQSYCRSRFFEIIKKKNISLTKLSPVDEIFLRNSMTEEIKKNNEKEILNLLKKYKTNEEDHQKISHFILKIYKDLEIFPSKNILLEMKVNPELTAFIQESGVMNTKDSEFFNSALEEMLKESKAQLKESDFKKLSTTGEHILSFFKSNEKFLSQEKVWKYYINTGYNLLYKGNRDLSKDFYMKALLVSKKSQKDDNFFYLLWADLLNQKYKEAVKTIDSHDLIKKFPELDERTRFWISYSFFKNNETSIARHLFKLITRNSPLSYYSILSLKHIDIIDNKVSPHGLVKQYQSETNIFSVSHQDFTTELKQSLSRLVIWNQLGYTSYAEQEVAEIMKSPQEKLLQDKEKYKHYSDDEIKRYITSSLIQDFNKSGNYLQTFKLLYQSFNQNIFSVETRSLKYLFPFEYVEQIRKIDNSLDPLLVLSLIRQESAFNPDAKSTVGARGLMQLMPSTARDFNSRVIASDLKTPETNLKIGMKYFKKLLTMFDGNLILSLASYNAGQNRVKYWVKNHFTTTDPLMMIESIPYDETRDYVKYIYRNLFFYNLLQNNNRLTLSLNESFKVNGF